MKICTPSFTSSEMHAAKLRRSDLLLKKKEPSAQDPGRLSQVDGGEGRASSVLA